MPPGVCPRCYRSFGSCTCPPSGPGPTYRELFPGGGGCLTILLAPLISVLALIQVLLSIVLWVLVSGVPIILFPDLGNIFGALHRDFAIVVEAACFIVSVAATVLV